LTNMSTSWSRFTRRSSPRGRPPDCWKIIKSLRSSRVLRAIQMSSLCSDRTDQYEHFLVKVYKAKLAAWKAAGLLEDYKILTVEPRSPSDPDVIFMFRSD